MIKIIENIYIFEGRLFSIPPPPLSPFLEILKIMKKLRSKPELISLICSENINFYMVQVIHFLKGLFRQFIFFLSLFENY